jgi:hypothetical protein
VVYAKGKRNERVQNGSLHCDAASTIGRRPIAAFGNSEGDLQMLQYTAAGNGERFMVIVRHTDAERESA